MSTPEFTGERLHAGDARFSLDWARHQAAYRWLSGSNPEARLLDLGSGSGEGSHRLAQEISSVVGVDRVAADAPRDGAAVFARGDLRRLPFRDGRFRTVASFQVIEHFEDPSGYLGEIARVLQSDGRAVISTPNVARSDGVNPYHHHEYTAAELRAVLAPYFAEVEIVGVGTSARADAVLRARSARIRTILRIDPLRLHQRLPQAWIEALFALGARLVRVWGGEGREPERWGEDDFPIGAPDEHTSLDWIAVCRSPRRPADTPPRP